MGVSVLIISILVVIGLVFGFVFAPTIISAIMESAQLQFQYISISKPTTSGFILDANASLTTSGPAVSCQVASMLIYVSYEGFDIGTAQFPQIDIDESSKTVALSISTSFTILNTEAFVNFAHGMLNTESVLWHLSGNTQITVFGFSFPVSFEKDVTIQGSPHFFFFFFLPLSNPTPKHRYEPNAKLAVA